MAVCLPEIPSGGGTSDIISKGYSSEGLLALGTSVGGLGGIYLPKPSDCLLWLAMPMGFDELLVAVSPEGILVLGLNDGLKWRSGVSEGLLLGGSGGFGFTSVRLLIREVNWADGLLVFGTGGRGSLLDRLVLP